MFRLWLWQNYPQFYLINNKSWSKQENFLLKIYLIYKNLRKITI